ncbi:hypothetical protein HWV62_5193 [Athelia sp. TMB]|nr:hypothetical protein HWV62_5193 [Athelia sp. TMB]
MQSEEPEESMAQRGAQNKFSGYKLAFLNRLGPEYDVKRAQDKSGEFIDHATGLFLRTFGKGQNFHQDPENDPGVPVPENDITSGCDTQAQADLEKNIYDKLRVIIGNWLRAWWRRLHKGEVQPAKVTKPIVKDNNANRGALGKLLAGAATKPHRRSAFTLYQEKHYAKRVKPEYQRRWAAEKKEYEAASPAERVARKLSKPQSVRTVTNTTREYWENESKAFKDEVQAQADEWYEQALTTWTLGLSVAKTPVDYHNQLAAISQHLQPIADAIAEQVGGDVVIFIVSPIPAKRGQLEARSISATRPGGGSTTWVEEDPTGVTYTERRLVDFARGNFTNAECALQALPQELIPENENDPIDVDGLYKFDQEDSLADEDDRVELKQPEDTITGTEKEDSVTEPISAPPSILSTEITFPSVPTLSPSLGVPNSPPLALASHSTSPIPSASVFSGLLHSLGTTAPAVTIIRPTVTSLPPLPTAATPIITAPPVLTAPPVIIAPPVISLPHVSTAPSSTKDTSSEALTKPVFDDDSEDPFVEPWDVTMPSSPVGVDDPPPSQNGGSQPEEANDLEVNTADSNSSSSIAVVIAPEAQTSGGGIMEGLTSILNEPQTNRIANVASDPISIVASEQDVTMKELMEMVAPKPFKARASKASLPVVERRTVCGPGVHPGRRERPIPPLIAQLLKPTPPTPAPATAPANIILPVVSALPQRSPFVGRLPPHMRSLAPLTAGGLLPDLNRWSSFECRGFKWLISGTETWGDWRASIRILTEYRAAAQFPVLKDVIFAPPPPAEVATLMSTLPVLRGWGDTKIQDLTAFAAQYHVWWKALQPAERATSTSPTLPPPEYDMDWSGLRRPGSNGIILVAIALRWWGTASNADANWRLAAQDFAYAIQCITSEPQVFVPHVPPTAVTTSSSSPIPAPPMPVATSFTMPASALVTVVTEQQQQPPPHLPEPERAPVTQSKKAKIPAKGKPSKPVSVPRVTRASAASASMLTRTSARVATRKRGASSASDQHEPKRKR